MGGAGGEFLAILGPGVEPGTLAAGKVVAGDGENLAHGRGAEGVDAAAVDVKGNIEGRPFLQDIERGAIAFQLALAGAERSHSAAVLVVNIIPVFGGLDEADSLVGVCLRAQACDG